MGLPQQSAGLAGRSTKFIGRQEVLVEIVKLSCLLKHVLVLTQLFRAVQVNKLIEGITTAETEGAYLVSKSSSTQPN